MSQPIQQIKIRLIREVVIIDGDQFDNATIKTRFVVEVHNLYDHGGATLAQSHITNDQEKAEKMYAHLVKTGGDRADRETLKEMVMDIPKQ